MTEDANPSREAFTVALADARVREAAMTIRESGRGLPEMLALGRSLAQACGADSLADRLGAELSGFQDSSSEIPDIRKVMGFASPFPVRALDQGVLLPEEIFLANREKFSQVTLTIGQPISELEAALGQIRQGGVLALRVPAAEITGASADTADDTEVYIYILPREIQRIVDAARAEALDAIVECIVEATLGPAAASATAEPVSTDGAPLETPSTEGAATEDAATEDVAKEGAEDAGPKSAAKLDSD